MLFTQFSRAGRPLRESTLFIGVILVCLFLLVAAVMENPRPVRTTIYSVYREWARAYYGYKTRDWLVLDGQHFYVKYRPQDQNVAKLVLDTAEMYYRPVSQNLAFVPKDKVLIAIYPTREELSKSFGWSADESAMGVYWAGVIRVLSPNDWLQANNRQEFESAFKSGGPMAHEFAHLVVDYLTGGNYPRWLTEGIAQYEERKLTGFTLDKPENIRAGDLYALGDMDLSFDSLPDQNLSYWESLSAVDFMVKRVGMDGVKDVLAELRHGKDIKRSIESVMGISFAQFEKEFRSWADAKLDKSMTAA